MIMTATGKTASWTIYVSVIPRAVTLDKRSVWPSDDHDLENEAESVIDGLDASGPNHSDV